MKFTKPGRRDRIRHSHDGTMTIRTRFKDSPRGGLGDAVLDYEITDTLTGVIRYEPTLVRARATAGGIAARRPKLAWGEWTHLHGVESSEADAGPVRVVVSVRIESGREWGAHWWVAGWTVSTDTAVRSYEWRTALDDGGRRRAHVQVRATHAAFALLAWIGEGGGR